MFYCTFATQRETNTYVFVDESFLVLMVFKITVVAVMLTSQQIQR